MSQQLIDHNPDLQRLQSEGFDVEVHDGLIYVHHVPYLNSKQEIRGGSLVFTYTKTREVLDPPADHTAYWIGERPFTMLGEEIPSLINGPKNGWNGHSNAFFLSLYPDSLPNSRYSDLYTKVVTYYHTIAGHAIAQDPEGAKLVQAPVIQSTKNDIFQYEDLNASRAGINGITNVFKEKHVAIVGLGGTGSYLLDFIAKTPVKEIHLYDDDVFSSHNAFRTPGAASILTIKEGMTKPTYLSSIYTNMHRGIIPHIEKITEENITDLFKMDMVFICVDSVRTRNFISRHLMDHKIPFIDSGLGLLLREDGLSGQVRVTTYDGYHEDHITDSFGKKDIQDDIYASNIQVAELNCLAAVMMLIRWKRQLGFYTHDVGLALEDVYNVGTNKILSSTTNEGIDSRIR